MRALGLVWLALGPGLALAACSDGAAFTPGPDAGTPPDAAAPDALTSDAGAPDAVPPPLGDRIERGQETVRTAPRPAFGALVAAGAGDRIYVVEARRDVEPGPFGLPWRSRFRLAAYDGTAEAWAFAAEPDDLIGDVVVHPSGEVTLSLERWLPEREAFDLVRLDAAGRIVGRTTLSPPATAPESDYGAADPRPLFRMKSDLADATTAGWVRLVPDGPEGEDVVAAVLSFVAVPEGEPFSQRLALGLLALDWRQGGYVERWARVVDGLHAASPAAWAYDELRWREQAIRPFLARDAVTAELVVGRAWNNSRCSANVAVFGEFTQFQCVFESVAPSENERLPLAVTRFDAAGARLGTRILAPDADAAEQLAFGLAARGGQLALAGAVVRTNPDGSKRTYPNPSGFVDYDGYVAVYDAGGELLRQHDYNLGRGDVLAALSWTGTGIVAAGASDWDRWQGGMSISRGASPLFVWLSDDGADARQRVVPLGDQRRHFNLHDVLVQDGAVIGLGFADAPMTHSADGGNTAARTFGPLRVELSGP